MLKYSLFIVLLCHIVTFVSAAEATKVAKSGSWNNANTWTPAGVPGDNEIIQIPEGVTVTVPGSDHTMTNSVLVIQGTLTMESTCWYCTNYGSLTFLGDNSSVIIENGGQVHDGTLFGGDTHFIAVDGVTFWSGGFCSSNCGGTVGDFISNTETAWPADASNPLPVTWVSFEGKIEKREVILEWVTATEDNNEGFVVERNIGGNSYDSIGFVVGNGNSKELNSYMFTDDIRRDDITYYRLRQIDFDGAFEYSKIVKIAARSMPNSFQHRQLEIYPNPIVSFVNIDNSLDNFMLFDVQGRLVLSGIDLATHEIEDHLEGYFSNAEKGIYFFTSKVDGQVMKKRLVFQ